MQPMLDPIPEKRSPLAPKEEVTMRLIIHMAENTSGISLEEVKPISCTQPTQDCQPQDETEPRQGPGLPNNSSPVDLGAAKS